MPMFGAAELAVAAAMMFAGSTVLSTVGFGIGVTTAPVLLLVLDPQTVVITVNTASLVLFVLLILQTRSHLSLRDVMPMAIAGLLGVPLGVFILSSAGADVLRIAITALILVLATAVAFDIRLPFPRGRMAGPAVGFPVGVLLTSTGIGGPLVALFLLTSELKRHAMRASLSVYFLLVESTGVIGYGVAGLFTPERITLILVVTVPVLLGYRIATVLVGRMNEQVFRTTVVGVILTTSLMALGREILRL